MTNLSLDQWGVLTPTSEMQKPLILSDDHADYLYEQSHDRLVEKMYQRQIDEKLAEEKAEKIKEIESHENYKKSNYIRVGGN